MLLLCGRFHYSRGWIKLARMLHHLAFVVIGIVTGIMSGLFGIGGGIVIVPILVFLMGYAHQAAVGTSLLSFLSPAGLLGGWAYYKAGKIGAVEIRAGLLIALGLFIGAYFGSRLAVKLPVPLLRKSFACLLVFVAFKLWFQK